MKKKAGCIATIICTVCWAASADVTVNFENAIGPGRDEKSVGSMTLNFSVDDSGRVTLDTVSLARPTEVSTEAVKTWLGPVGTVDWKGARGTEFSITLDGRKAGNKTVNILRLSRPANSWGTLGGAAETDVHPENWTS
ncbi:hypothetical protein [Tichowtungia aerotolerans]|uniref:Uncharacterized protein n=1 Tax=Tichowtungia aerotolerans TaxID=2697043 RepID=A0A6P1M4K0_9BACT|nr:hypothetical protein [Tichowtungia aerotolerans]QHI69719.1 hypothetical protein GT409_09725 [Tichowtungia aerotolerans]